VSTSSTYAESNVETLNELRNAGTIGNRVAVVHAASSRHRTGQRGAPRLMAAKYELVYDGSYPRSTQNLTPVISEAQRANPDVFMAVSYPPDTMALTETARVRGFNPKVFYTAVGSAFPQYKQRFGPSVDGVMGVGGWNPDATRSARTCSATSPCSARSPPWARRCSTRRCRPWASRSRRIGREQRRDRQASAPNSFDTIVG